MNLITLSIGIVMILGSVILYFIDFFKNNEVSVKLEKPAQEPVKTAIQSTVQDVKFTSTGVNIIDALEKKALEGLKIEPKVEIKEIKQKKSKKRIIQKIKEKIKPKKNVKSEKSKNVKTNPLADTTVYELKGNEPPKEEKFSEMEFHEKPEEIDRTTVPNSLNKAKELSEKIEERTKP